MKFLKINKFQNYRVKCKVQTMEPSSANHGNKYTTPRIVNSYSWGILKALNRKKWETIG